MKWDPFSRRHFLQGAGAALALPLLPSLLSKRALAQAAPVQKSFIGIAAFNGLYRMIGPYSQLMPPLPYDITSTAGFTPLTPSGLHTIYSRPLSTFTGGGQVSDIIDASFNAMLPKMLMMQGFDYLPFYAHHHAHFGDSATSSDFESVAPMATLDQVLANSSGFYANPALKGRSVVYTANNDEAGGPLGGLSPGGLATSATYQDPTQPTSTPIIPTPRFCNPKALWDHYFSSGSGAPSGPSYKATMVDRVLQDYKALRNGRTIGAVDAQILDQHVAFLQAAEQQVQATTGCSPGTTPPANAPSGAPWGAGLSAPTQDTQADRVALIQAMNSVITSLIACGLCNSFLGSTCSLTSTNTGDWHTWSHHGYANDSDSMGGGIADATSYNSLINDNRIVMKYLCLDLAQKLDSIKPDGVTSLLDNALIACVQEHSKRGHECWGVPIITFGSAGGVFKTGQYLDFRNQGSGDDMSYTRLGYPINQVWANWLQAMGMQTAEYEALNKVADPLFTIGSRLTGYGTSNFFSQDHKAKGYSSPGWNGYDLSSWLPFIHG